MVTGLGLDGIFPYTLKINDNGGGTYSIVWVDASNNVKKTVYTF
jgi:hypothetical protein